VLGAQDVFETVLLAALIAAILSLGKGTAMILWTRHTVRKDPVMRDNFGRFFPEALGRRKKELSEAFTETLVAIAVVIILYVVAIVLVLLSSPVIDNAGILAMTVVWIVVAFVSLVCLCYLRTIPKGPPNEEKDKESL